MCDVSIPEAIDQTRSMGCKLPHRSFRLRRTQAELAVFAVVQYLKLAELGKDCFDRSFPIQFAAFNQNPRRSRSDAFCHGNDAKNSSFVELYTGYAGSG